MCTGQLDYLSQELHRVDKTPETLPRYRTVFWNCHDYAVYFAALICDQYPPTAVLRELAVIVEESKFIFCRAHAKHIARMQLFSFGIGTVSSLLNLLGFRLARAFVLLALILTTLCNIYHVVWKTWQIQAFQERETWLHILEQRYPKLSAVRDKSNIGGLMVRHPSWIPRTSPNPAWEESNCSARV
ncbi:hypothetical protein BBP40_011821 [Aspergillus hancockii]|nr:hypothetical protein BBP40_011821 [Aspergillus hancockii]